MINDNGKALAFQYNALNLPYETKTTAGNEGRIKFMYNAAGQKLRTMEYTTATNKTDSTEYAGAFVYKNGKLDYIIMPEGRILVTDAATRTYAYEYHLKDHLGNTRATYTAGTNGSTTLTQYAAYYPFGLAINSLSWQLVNENDPNKNPYLYNGKELHTELNLNLHDYGARYYDAAVGRWWSIDPLAELYNSLTPYNYVTNNPVGLIDPNGMYPDIPSVRDIGKHPEENKLRPHNRTQREEGRSPWERETGNVFFNAHNNILEDGSDRKYGKDYFEGKGLFSKNTEDPTKKKSSTANQNVLDAGSGLVNVTNVNGLALETTAYGMKNLTNAKAAKAGLTSLKTASTSAGVFGSLVSLGVVGYEISNDAANTHTFIDGGVALASLITIGVCSIIAAPAVGVTAAIVGTAYGVASIWTSPMVDKASNNWGANLIYGDKK